MAEQQTKTKKKRIFEIAKELNISHIEIVKFLKREDIPVKTINSPVSEGTYFKILEEFAKEKDIIERIRKEKARKEAEEKRKAEEEARRTAEEEHKKIEAKVSAEAQQYFDQAIDSILQAAKTIELDLVDKVTAEKRAEKGPKDKPEKSTEVKETESAQEKRQRKKKERKKKLKRVSIQEIEERLGQKKGRDKKDRKEKRRKKRESKIDERKVEESIRRTMARMDEKSTKKKYKKKEKETEAETEEKKTIKISEFTTVETLANMMNVDPADVIQKCIQLGMFVTINQRLDFDTIALIADEFGFEAEQVEQYGEELFKIEQTEEDLENAQPRSPVVTVMGHVDHGKTSLLDHIREENVVAGESGGITQHIGAYKVKLKKGNEITFLDTPGHEAFTTMRARGARVTDIVVLIIAADDGVMPQTVEAINHARAAEVPLIVAINKIDKPNADIEKVKRGLSEHDILVESWGGKIQAAEISAKTGEGIDHLLNLILLESEMLELKANPETHARGTVIEAEVDKRHGPMATVLIQKGSLHVGDSFVCGAAFGRVRAMYNERGKKIKEVGPSEPAVVVGFDVVPNLADVFAGVSDDKEARKIAGERQRIQREEQHRQQEKEWSLDAISAQIAEGKTKQLNVVLKGDVDGSVEAISETLQDLGNEEVSVAIKHKAVGQITESDVLLAKASDAIIIGFNVTANPKVKDMAKNENVEIRRYRVIYELVDDVTSALEGLLTPDKVESHLGEAEVRAVFKIPDIGNIAGCYVTEGIIQRNANGRLYRDKEVVHEAEVTSLKRFKDDVKEVKEGFECGINLEGFSDYQEGDRIEVYDIKSVKRKLT